MNLIKKILWIVVASWAAFFAQEVWAVGNDVMDGNILWACDFEAAQREESPLTVEGMKEHMLVSGCEADNESVICANGGIGNYFGNIPGLFETVGTNCLKVNTGTDPFCIAPYLVTDEGKFSARYAPPEGQSLYVDALMQFTVTPLADTVSGGASWSDSNSEAQNTGNASLLRVKDLSLQRIIRFSYCGLVADLDNRLCSTVRSRRIWVQQIGAPMSGLRMARERLPGAVSNLPPPIRMRYSRHRIMENGCALRSGR